RRGASATCPSSPPGPSRCWPASKWASARARASGRPRSLDGQVVDGGFAVVAHDEERAGEGRRVPGLPVESGEAGALAGPIRAPLQQQNLALLGLHEQEVVHEQQLAVAEVAALPQALAGSGVEAGEHAVVEPVDEAPMHEDVRELRLEPRTLPLHR